MSRSRSPSPLRRRITRLLAASGLLLGLGSCAAVLDVDGYGDAAAAMCHLIDRCYKKEDCQATITKNLQEAPSKVRSNWLARLSDYACLTSCSASRSCLDLAPLCAASKEVCTEQVDCCDSLHGQSDCGLLGTEMKCCQTRGAACSDEHPCCVGAGFCQDGFCGSQRCAAPKEACTRDSQCCTMICQDNQCAKEVCRKDGVDCTTAAQCCHGFCDLTTRRCALPPVCAAEGGACAVASDCCDDRRCVVASGTTKGTCQTSTCAPLALECATDDQCCSGRCDPTSFSCAGSCSPTGSACDADSGCCDGSCLKHVCVGQCSTSACSADEDCCSKRCFNGSCSAQCGSFDAHPGCKSGGPLDASSAGPCVAAICAVDPFCCCNAWDDYCVDAFYNQGSPCVDTCP